MKSEIKVLALTNPLDNAQQKHWSEPAGRSIKQITAEALPGHDSTFALVNGKVCDSEYITSTGDEVILRAIPAGDNFDGDEAQQKSMGWGTAGLLVGFLLAPFTGGISALVGIGLFGAAVVFGAAIEIGQFIDGLTSTAEGGVNRASGQTSPALRGARNRASPGGKLPVVLGKHRITPFYGANPYTSISGTNGADMYLHMLFVVGVGALKLSQIKVGESVLATNAAGVTNGVVDTSTGVFSGATVQVYTNGTSPSLYPWVVTEDQPGTELKYTDVRDKLWRATPPKTTQVEIEITLPQGIYKYNDANEAVAHTVTVVVKRRAFGSGTAWASATTVHTFTVNTMTMQTARFMFSQAVTSGQWEYAVSRESADDVMGEGFYGTSRVAWSAFRSIRASTRPIAAAVASGVTVMAVKLKATADLQGSVDQISCIAEALIPYYSGSGSGAASWTSTTYSQNPAAVLLNALRGPANPRPVPDSLMDWASFESWYNLCATKGWTCNAVVSSGRRLGDAVAAIATSGRAAVTLKYGKYSVIADEPKVTPVQHFTPRNSWGFRWSKAFPDPVHALKVTYVSASDDYAPNQRVVYDDGYDSGNATKFQQVSLFGVTSADLAWKHGRYLLAVRQLRPEVFTLETDAESIVCDPGDKVLVSHDAILVGLAYGRVKAVAVTGGNVTGVEVDETVLFESGKSYGARFRLPDGTSVYAALNNAAGYEGSYLSLTTPIAEVSAPRTGDLFSFGEANVETIPCLLVSKEPSGDSGYRLTLTNEGAGVHTADSGAIPDFESDISRPPTMTATPAPPTPATQAVTVYVQQTEDAAANAEVLSPAQAVEVVARNAPRYLGRYYAAHPADPNPGDSWLVYDEEDAPVQRGLWWNNAGTSERVTTSSPLEVQGLFAQAVPDVAWAEAQGTYGAAADYGMELAFESIGAVTAFINSLFSNNIKIQPGGSFRAGNRFSDAGGVADDTKAGVFIGTDGTLKAADVDGAGFAVEPGVGVTFTGVDLELTESDLSTYGEISPGVPYSLSHEGLGLVWRDQAGAIVGGVKYHSDGYIYLYWVTDLGTVDIRMSDGTVVVRVGGADVLGVHSGGIDVTGAINKNSATVPAVYIQSTQPAGGNTGDIWFKV